MNQSPEIASAHRKAPAPGLDRAEVAALCILLLTAAIALLWSHVKLLSQDEIFVLQTDSVSSVRELIHIQRTVPISLDPLVYHLLAHGATRIFGPTPFALRLPSILGFLLMQICVFFSARSIAGSRAGVVALAFPALTATLFYAPEARPYGLLLGFYALTFLTWQNAARRRESRTVLLIVLAVTIALTINTHYFGVLLLIPLCLGEFARTLQRRRLDLPVIIAILLGMVGILGTLPFQPAAAEFRKHYYNAGAISFRAVSQAYRSLFVSYNTQPLSEQRVVDALLIVFAIVLLVLNFRRLRRKDAVILPAGELIFLLALAALPIFGTLLALFVTHSIEVRYVLSAIIAISVFVAIAAEPWLRSRGEWAAIATLLIVGVLVGGYVRIHSEQRQAKDEIAFLILPTDIKAHLFALPDSHLYIQDMGHFEIASYYAPDPEVRSRIALLYSREEELRWDHHDTASLTAMHMRHFTGLTIVPYSQLKQEPGDHLLVLYHSGWDWTDQALAAEDAKMKPLGRALNGDAVMITPRDTH